MRKLAIVALLLLATTTTTDAQQRDSAVYVVRLGVDTTAVERWVWSRDSLHVVSVTRSPRTVVRRYVLRYDSAGQTIGFSTGSQGPEPTPTQGAIPIVGGTYAPYGAAVWQAMRADADSAAVRMRAGSSVSDVPVRRTAPGRYVLPNQFAALLTVSVAPDGAVTAIDAGGGATVERVPWLDIESVTREFASRDARGHGLGPLSPRDTVRARIGGATVLVDYGRPSARGRPVMGGLVPYGAVWRTGANDATQLITDAPIRVGSLRLEPGRYSLFTVPGERTWQLIVNRQVGMSGLDHDPVQDVGRVSMQPERTTSDTEQFTIRIDNGRLVILWGDAAVSVPITAG